MVQIGAVLCCPAFHHLSWRPEPGGGTNNTTGTLAAPLVLVEGSLALVPQLFQTEVRRILTDNGEGLKVCDSH